MSGISNNSDSYRFNNVKLFGTEYQEVKKEDVNLTLQNFRDMVNYDNTTNKGHVRLLLGTTSTGAPTVTLHKVNNQLKIKTALRWYMNADNNKLLRQLLEQAFQPRHAIPGRQNQSDAL